MEDRTSRLFVALSVPASARAVLSATISGAAIDDVRWTDPHGWHVTLAFLGDTPTDRLGTVIDVATSTLTRTPLPARIGLGDPGRFGDHTLWIGVHDDPPGSISHLGTRIQSDLHAAGLQVTRRRLTPHVTVGRSRRRGRVTAAQVRALTTTAFTGANWRPSAVHIVQAHLGDGPARYATLASIPGTADAPPHPSR